MVDGPVQSQLGQAGILDVAGPDYGSTEQGSGRSGGRCCTEKCLADRLHHVRRLLTGGVALPLKGHLQPQASSLFVVFPSQGVGFCLRCFECPTKVKHTLLVGNNLIWQEKWSPGQLVLVGL